MASELPRTPAHAEAMLRNRGGFGRRTWLLLGGGGLALFAYLALTAHGGPADPTQDNHLSHGAVIINSALLVLREGLEAILVLAAVTASLMGGRPEQAATGGDRGGVVSSGRRSSPGSGRRG